MGIVYELFNVNDLAMCFERLATRNSLTINDLIMKIHNFFALKSAETLLNRSLLLPVTLQLNRTKQVQM